MIRLVWIMIAFPLLVSCAGSKGAYEAIQTGQKSDCQALFGDEYDKCIEKYSKPYDEYKRDRDEVLDKR